MRAALGIGLLCVTSCARGEAVDRTSAPATGSTAALTVVPSSTMSAATPAGTNDAPATAPSSTAFSTGTEATEPPPGMTRIPAGLFVMGAYGEGRNEEERPAHEAIVATFDLDTTEVTVEAYRRCRDAGACTVTHVGRQFCNEQASGRDRHPINCIDLTQAAAYCTFVGKRLPSEREWEYAASGGSEKREFSHGNEPPTESNACYHHPFGSCEVGSFPAGAFGLRDMTGNVWEWTQSEFRPYPSSGALDPLKPGRYYVYRGGSWSRRFPKWLRNALRNRYHPDEWSASIGVRCARSVDPPQCPAESEWQEGACVRVAGIPRCEPDYAYDDAKRQCVPDPRLDRQSSPGPTASTLGSAENETSVTPPQVNAPCCSRTRTPEYDADCQKNWPSTPASYRFEGGGSFPERQPVLRSQGCVPRDMGRTWTSACCQG